MGSSNPGDTSGLERPHGSPAIVGRQTPGGTLITDVAGMSHPGKVRPVNEDHFIVTRFGRFLETLQTNLPAQGLPWRTEEMGYGMVVADGLGGHAAGEVASRLAITVLLDLVLKTPDWILRLDDEAYVEEVVRRAKERFADIDVAILEKGLVESKLEGMATTLTIAATLGDALILAHLGDSRAYLLRRGVLMQVTRDHTVVQDLIDKGVLSPQDAPTHRMKHVLTHALGTAAARVEPDVQRLGLERGDSLLLCTDGLSNLVTKETIQQMLGSGASAEQTCQRLIDAALEAGGKDNVTVVVAHCRRR